MSFLDERDDRPRQDDPRRPSSRRPPPRGPSSDRQTLLVRRVIALVGALAVLILLAVAVRGCLNAREQRAFEDYIQEVSALVTESNQQSAALFDLLGAEGGRSSVEAQNTVNSFRVQAEQLVDRAESTERPDQFDDAQEFLAETLEFRSAGLSGIAGRLSTALGDEGRGAATAQIAAQMQNFLASDVIYLQRVVPSLEGPLKEEDLAGEVAEIPESQFLPDIDWLQPAVVADAIAGVREGRSSTEEATPGLHGTGLGEVTVAPSGQALVEGTPTDIPVTDDVAFDVEVVNQGENDEVDVPVRISIEGGDQPIELDGELDSIDAGESATATIPLTERPPRGQELELTVTVEGVPGEEMLDNNEGSFAVTFSG